MEQGQIEAISNSGISFQKKSQILLSKYGFEISDIEFPVSGASDFRYKDTDDSAVDIIASKVINDYIVFLIIECKYHNPSNIEEYRKKNTASWVFFGEEEVPYSMECIKVIDDPGNRGGDLAPPSKSYELSSNVFLLTNAYSYAEQGYVLKKDDKDQYFLTSNEPIFKACHQVSLAQRFFVDQYTKWIIEENEKVRSGSVNKLLFHPLLITNNQMQFCSINDELLADGQVINQEAWSCKDVGSVIYEYPLREKFWRKYSNRLPPRRTKREKTLEIVILSQDNLKSHLETLIRGVEESTR